ncbi:hypothetical protein Pint_07832 [Pistacia integerrima]|uniref:Uncharacterized protein n=1 Tax=Pistacia integerrima TaxID=434235 RepID=A0ACC0XXR4_9ROSI|nr:hypothetical protein Pint_07832 [Pistacia integerrima]
MPILLVPSPIPTVPAISDLKLSPESKPFKFRSWRLAATRDVDTFTEKSSYLFQLSATEADSLVDYDLKKIGSIYRRKPLILLRRIVQVGTSFGWWFGSRYVDKLMERSDQMFKVRAVELRKLLVELGPAYVKIAQAVSSRADLIPPSYLDELSVLQDRITPFSTDIAFNTIEQELGLSIDELFSEISPEPVAAASLGQVYQARLRHSGQVVAVKVQRPGVQAAISLDILILHFMAGLVRRAGKLNTDLQAVVDEWASSLFRELDYKKEANNGLKFRQLYGEIPDVLVPQMHVEQTTRKVLLMEWIEGKKLYEVKDLYLIEVGVYCSFNQLLEYGFYHADPHPGNLLRTNDGKLAYIDCRTFILYLSPPDFGMMGEFKQELRTGFIEACLHLVNRDFDALAKDFVTLGLLPPTAEKEAVTIALTGMLFMSAWDRGLQCLPKCCCQRSPKYKLWGSFGKLRDYHVRYKFKFQIPSYFSLVIRSLAVLEGIAISFDPNYKVLGSTYPWIARKVLTDGSPQLRSSLETLLYEEGVFRIDRLESLLQESLRARTEKALVKKQVEDTDSRAIIKQVLSFTLTEKGAFVREILLQEFAKGLDALGLATLDSLTSAMPAPIPFAASTSVSSLTEEDLINLRTLRRLMLLLSGFQRSEGPMAEVKELSPYKNQGTFMEEAFLTFYQLPSIQEILPVLSVIPEV